MKDLGHMHHFFGIKVWREDGKILISQSKYANKIIKIFNINGCKLTSTPLE